METCGKSKDDSFMTDSDILEWSILAVARNKWILALW